jgi:hypothetical protein
VYQVIRALGNGRFMFTFLHEDDSELGDFPARLEEAGARIEKVGKIRGKWDVGGFLRHVQRFRQLSPDIVHFNQSNPYNQQFSVVAARCAGVRNLVAIYHLTRGRRPGLSGRCLSGCAAWRVLVPPGRTGKMCGDSAQTKGPGHAERHEDPASLRARWRD